MGRMGISKTAMGKTAIEHYWQNYLQTLSDNSGAGQAYRIAQFSNNPELADELGQRVLDGVKTATCSALWEWTTEQKQLPEIGSKTIILGGAKTPICIIETTEVTIQAFKDVDARFAYDEGDLTLKVWQEKYWVHFSRVLSKIEKTPTVNMPLVCERFRVVYQSLPQGFIIRDCEPTEANTVLSLWQEAGITVSPVDELNNVIAAIVAKSTHLLVAEHDYQIIGSVLAAFDGWQGNLYRLVVHPDFRRFGVATKLVAEVEQRLSKQGVKKITVVMENSYEHTMSFWQAVDYESIGTCVMKLTHTL